MSDPAIELEWKEPPAAEITPDMGLTLDGWADWNALQEAALWAEVQAESALDFTDGGFNWQPEELERAAAHAMRALFMGTRIA